VPAADAPIRAPRRRKAKPTHTPAAAIHHATARGPQGLPIQSKSPQRRAPTPSRTRTTQGPQGLPIQRRSKQGPAQKPLKSLPHPKPKPSRSSRYFPNNTREASIRRSQRAHKTPSATPGDIASALRNELEGHGALASILGAIAKHADIRPTGSKTIDQSLGIKRGSAAELPVRAVHDLINAPAQVIPSLYVPAKAALKAAGGNPSELKQLGKDIAANDPIYNLVTGNVSKALKLANEHPGYAALEGRGFVTGIDQAAGRAARAGVAGRRVKQAATRRRPARVSEGTLLAEQRLYPKGLAAKAAVKGRENAKREHVANLRRTAQRIESDAPERAASLRREANRKDPDVMQAGEIKRQVTELFSAHEELRREHRGKAIHEVEQAVKGTNKAERNALSVVAQRITSASKDDIRAYVTQLEHEHPLLDNAGRRDNESLRRQLDKVLKDEKYNPSAAEGAARRYQKVSQDLQRKLVDSHLITQEEADLARLTPYAARNMGAKFDRDTETLYVERNGKRQDLTVEDIRKDMRANDVEEPAFLTQAPNQRGARNFNIRGERMQTIRSERRTGAATVRGVFDPHPDTLKENAAKARGLVDAVDTWKDFVNQVAVRERGVGDIQPLTYKDAQRRVENLHAGGAKTEYAVIRAYPFGARKALVDKLLDSKDPQQIAGYKDLMDEALNFDSPKGDLNAGQWIVVPKAAAEELRAHLSAMAPTTFEKAWSAWNQTFRSTVLATSATWLIGNLSEAGLRAAVARAGPRSYLTGHRVLRELRRLDPDVAEMAVARTVAGGHMSFSRRAMRYSNAEQFERTNLEGLAEAMAKVRRTPGPKWIADAWNHYTDWVFNSLNGRMESQFQIAMLGRTIRDSPLMDDKMFKLSKKAINEAAQGLKETPAQIAFGRQIDRMYGKYGKFSPTQRRIVAYYTPFLAWSLNAATFVYSVLPRDHPVVTSLILSMEQATEEWRKDHGLDLYMAGANPAFLQGSIPGRAKNFPVSRFTPFGAFGDYMETLASNVLPQASAFLDIGKHGIDFKGQQLRNPRTGEPLKPDEKAVAIGRAFVESTVPLVGLGQRIADKGPIAILGGAAGYAKGPNQATGGSAPPRDLQRQLRARGGGTGPADPQEILRQLRARGG
jgi:hypothetical protein